MKLLLIILALAPAACFAQASVWAKLQMAGQTELIGQVKELKISTKGVTVSVLEDKPDAQPQELELCMNEQMDSAFNVFNGEVTRTLREAFRNHEKLAFTYRGPWNPCVESVSLFDPNSRKSSPDL